MSKVKTAFFCQNCGYESVKWVGQCPSCGQWNTFIEELIQKETGKKTDEWRGYHDEKRNNKTISLNQVKSSEEKRLPTADAELNRVLCGGIVTGSLHQR
jgi:DNA repair protein RadA/Sms